MKRLFSFVSLMLVAVRVVSACHFSISTADLTPAVLAKDVRADTFEPVEPASTFPTDRPVINWVVTVANVHSTLALPTSGAWPAGKTKVEICLNDKLDRTLEYTIAQ